MKVLIINRDVGTGSVGKICEDLYSGVISSGNECKVAYAWKNKSAINSNDLFCFGSINTIRLNSLSARLFDNDGLKSRKGTNKLIKYINNYNPDLIHIHGCYGYYVNVKLLLNYIKKKHVPLVSTLHSCWDFTGHCAHFTLINCSKWKTLCNHCPQKSSYPKSVFLDRSKRNYLVKKESFSDIDNFTIVVPSDWLASIVMESFLNYGNIEIIKNGIDLNYFKPTKMDLSKYGVDSERKIILGVASVWSDKKGLNDFARLASFASDDYQIVMVGLKDEQIKLLPSNVVCISRTESKEELAALYSTATVLFNPTHEDNYPTVNLESIACGTPVVTYQTGGSPEAVNEFSFGAVIEKDDFESLLKFVDYSFAKKPMLKQDKDSISKETMIKKYLVLYDKVLKA